MPNRPAALASETDPSGTTSGSANRKTVGDARAGVADADDHRIVARLEGHRQRSTGGCVADAVVEQVLEHARDEADVADNQRQIDCRSMLHRDPAALRDQLEIREHVLDEIVRGERFGSKLHDIGLEPGELE